MRTADLLSADVAGGGLLGEGNLDMVNFLAHLDVLVDLI
jgi:hypothetical protein